MQVHIETMQQEADYTYKNRKGVECSIEQHSVEITINGDRRRVSCGEYDGKVYVQGLALRFSQGNKVWPGMAVYWRESGNVNNLRPNIDRRGYFSLVGYFDDYREKMVASKHNAVA